MSHLVKKAMWDVLRNWYKMSGYFYHDDLVEKIEPNKIWHLTKYDFFHSFKCQCLMLSSYVRCAAKLWYDEWLFNHDDLAKKIEGQNLTLDEIWLFS